MIYIIAGSHREALHYVREHNLKDNWKYVFMEQDLRGIHNPVIIRLGTWHTHERIDQILDVVDERNFEILDSGW